MTKKDLIKKILELGKELEKANGFDAVMIINDMEIEVDNYTKQLPIQNVVQQSEQLVCPKCGNTGRCEPRTLSDPDGQECDYDVCKKEDWKLFFYKSKGDEYILYNKPLLSLRNIDGTIKGYLLEFDELKKIVEERAKL